MQTYVYIGSYSSPITLHCVTKNQAATCAVYSVAQKV